MGAPVRPGERPQLARHAQTLAVFARGIIAEAVFVIGLAAVCGIAIVAVLLAGG